MFETLIFGPVIALLPKRWREDLLATRGNVSLVPGAIISGVVEAILGLAALIVWYSIFVTMAAQAVATSSGPGAGNSRIGMYVYVLFWLNPITWIVAYFGVEGAVRAVCAISTDQVYGMLPLFLIERSVRALRPPKPELPLVADEILPGGPGCDMKIACCRARTDWTYPFTIRYGGAFFQVVASARLGAGVRPYIYSLRRLPPGEVARGLKDYHPEDILRWGTGGVRM